MIVTATRFKRTSDDGYTISYVNERGGTVAYLDDLGDGTADVFVYDEYLDRGRHYDKRDLDKANAIIERHIARLGGTMDPEGLREIDPSAEVHLYINTKTQS